MGGGEELPILVISKTGKESGKFHERIGGFMSNYLIFEFFLLRTMVILESVLLICWEPWLRTLGTTLITMGCMLCVPIC